MSPHSKMVFLMIIFMAWMIASIGKLAGRLSFFSRALSHQLMTMIACSVSMLLYIDVASAVKSLALAGRRSGLVLFRTCWLSHKLVCVVSISEASSLTTCSSHSSLYWRNRQWAVFSKVF